MRAGKPITNKFYAPDDSGDWEDLGPAIKRRWPNGIPSVIVNEEGVHIFKEYAGNVWKKVQKQEDPEGL